MKIIFFGTPDYVLPILDSLHREFKEKNTKSPIVAVVTQAPKPVGREKKLMYSPIDDWAHKRALPKFFDSRDLIREKIEADIGILAAYGEIIPNEVISHFPKGILNIHPSLLPKWRGASPIQASILSGETQTGVSVIKLDDKLDHGPIVSSFKEDILPSDTTETLRKRLFEKSAEFLANLLPSYLAGKIRLKDQSDKDATFTRTLKKEDGFIPLEYLTATLQGETFKGDWKIGFVKDFSLNPNPYSLDCFIRAMNPWPMAWSNVQLGKGQEVKGTRIKILSAELSSDRQALPRSRLLIPKLVQLEGKNVVSWEQFKDGYKDFSF